MTDQQKIEQYLSAFRVALRTTPEPQHGEIVREITAHIRDAAEEPGATVSAVLARLGPPETLARQYGEGVLLQTARRSLSPLLLLRAALRLATKENTRPFGLLLRRSRLSHRRRHDPERSGKTVLSFSHWHVAANAA